MVEMTFKCLIPWYDNDSSVDRNIKVVLFNRQWTGHASYLTVTFFVCSERNLAVRLRLGLIDASLFSSSY